VWAGACGQGVRRLPVGAVRAGIWSSGLAYRRPPAPGHRSITHQSAHEPVAQLPDSGPPPKEEGKSASTRRGKSDGLAAAGGVTKEELRGTAPWGRGPWVLSAIIAPGRHPASTPASAGIKIQPTAALRVHDRVSVVCAVTSPGAEPTAQPTEALSADQPRSLGGMVRSLDGFSTAHCPRAVQSLMEVGSIAHNPRIPTLPDEERNASAPAHRRLDCGDHNPHPPRQA